RRKLQGTVRSDRIGAGAQRESLGWGEEERMPSYYRLGDIPRKRHVQFRLPNGRLVAEEVFGAEGFSGNYSILYHLALLSQVRRIEHYGTARFQEWPAAEHRHHHLRTARLNAPGNPIDGCVPLMFNDDVTLSLATLIEPQPFFYKNGTHDELVYVHEGTGVLATQFGNLPFGPG